MDIHRARFVPYPPSTINALAFSHADPQDGSRDSDCLKLALGRANGNIEIWNPAKGAWLQERVFYGGKDRSVEGLAWTQEPDIKNKDGKIVPGRLRLFSIGYSSSVTEWDLASGLPAQHSNGNHSEVWCFAAQPKSKLPRKGSAAQEVEGEQKLIAGCADGTLVLLSTADNELRFDKFVARSTTKKARALSVTYKDRDIVLAGFANSMIRVYDTRNGNVIRNISLGSGPRGGSKETLVWKVKCLPNGDFVSGDSNGDVRFYSGKNYSQTQQIAAHEADVLDLAVSRDGTMVFSGGMDRRTCFYTSNKKIAVAPSGKGGKWIKVSHKRYHDHDVKAMATYDGSNLSVVVSGGIDTQPVVVPLRHFGKELSRGLPALPQSPPLVSAPEARLMVSWWNCEIRVWRIKNQEVGTEKPKVIARLALQGDENISSVTITSDGGLLAAATANGVKLFQLLQLKSAAGTGLRIRKVEMPATTGARLIQFSPDGRWLATITSMNDILVARILWRGDSSDLPRVLPEMFHLRRLQRDQGKQNDPNGPLWPYRRSISQVKFSSDGTVLAVTDLAGYIDTWVTEGHEDPTAPEVDINELAESATDDDESDSDEESHDEQMTCLGQRWIRNPSAHLLPRLDSTPVLLSFQPNPAGLSRPEPNGNPAVHPTRHNPHPHSHDIPDTEHRLLLVTADRQLHLFDVLAGRLSEWSRRNPPSSYPSHFRMLDLPVKGCTWDVRGVNVRLWLYGEKWLFMFDLSKDLPIPASREAPELTNGNEEKEMAVSKKRKRDLGRAVSRKGASGAGDVVPEKEAPVTKMRKFTTGKDGEAKPSWTEVYGNMNRAAESESDDDDDDRHEALVRLGRSAARDGLFPTEDGTIDGDIPPGRMELAEEEEAGEVLGQRTRHHEPWWHTFKYRPILGMVPIGGKGQPLEVVLVERPSWDLDLPPRFVGSHE